MPCEKYKEALTGFAANGENPTGELRAHLNTCLSCCVYFGQEQSLLAAIDTGLHSEANALLPATLLWRLEARLAQQVPPTPGLSASSVYAGAGLTIAAALILFLLPNSRSRDAKRQSSVAVETSPQRAIERQKSESNASLRVAAAPVRHTLQHAPTLTTKAEPEVLVPPDERIAFERFLSDLNGREDLAVALVKPLHEQRQQRVVSLETPDIEIAALTMEPIAEISDR
jgi:hypothetical protein